MYSIKDRRAIATWCRTKASYDSVANTSSIGLVENIRFTEKARCFYLKLWLWSSMKPSQHEQAIIWDKMGTDFVKRRIERANKISKSLAENL